MTYNRKHGKPISLGEGSWNFLNTLGKTRMLPHERPLVDKYGLGV